ncbi:MAG: GNAT family N-acetyltransferase [Bacteroidia bacterium]
MEVIYEHSDYRIIVEEKPHSNAIAMLHATLWGTNGPIFEHLDTREKVVHLSGSLAFTLEKKGRTIGTCTVLERDIRIDGKNYKTWYGRYFAVDKDFQGKIFGNLLLKYMKEYLEKISDMPTIFYAYVDQTNLRSGKLLRHTGFQVIRNFETTIFSRIYPKKDKRVSRIKREDRDGVLHLLKTQYSKDTFFNSDNLFFQDNYFVLKEGEDIIAGVQASRVNWRIKSLPGFSGKIMIKVLPHVPFISRLFNPEKFRFAAFEGIYCKEGREDELFRLMESACAELQLCTGMVWMDPDSALNRRVKKAGDWGLMDKMQNDLPAHVVAGFTNVPVTEQEQFHKIPAYISAFDLT